jgi:S-adenosylmethionine:tRNA ribosyltransferase-isomerase
MHSEWFHVPEIAADTISQATGRIFAVGTTSVRTLESAAAGIRRLRSGAGVTRLYIQPGYKFRCVDALVTNFHVPRSSLMILVSALAGRDLIMQAYHEALANEYRFLSLGDAMLIL